MGVCGLTCKVKEEHVPKDCRCKRHEKKEWKDETKFKPPTDHTLEEFKRKTRFKPPIQSQETLQEEKRKYTVKEERRLKEEFD